jgi:hypothetical protein
MLVGVVEVVVAVELVIVVGVVLVVFNDAHT